MDNMLERSGNSRKTVMIIILLIFNILITEKNLVWFPDSHAAGSGLGNQTFSKSDGDPV